MCSLDGGMIDLVANCGVGRTIVSANRLKRCFVADLLRLAVRSCFNLFSKSFIFDELFSALFISSSNCFSSFSLLIDTNCWFICLLVGRWQVIKPRLRSPWAVINWWSRVIKWWLVSSLLLINRWFVDWLLIGCWLLLLLTNLAELIPDWL